MGHTYLQKLAPRKSMSITNAETKYPRMMQAVAHGLSHNKKASYAHKYVTSRPAAIHLERSARGQRYRGRTKRRPRSRGIVKGQAMQNKLPATSSAMTANARQ